MGGRLKAAMTGSCVIHDDKLEMSLSVAE